MVDKEYYAMLLDNEEYLELIEKYKTRDLGLIAQLIIKEGQETTSFLLYNYEVEKLYLKHQRRMYYGKEKKDIRMDRTTLSKAIR